MMANVPEGFDRMSPEHAATVVAFLASPQCPFTGRIIGVVGDNVHIYNGWTVAHHISNGQQKWTIDKLSAALADFPAQQIAPMQSINGVEVLSMPPDATLEQLAAIERG